MPLKGVRYRWKNGVRLAFSKRTGKVVETKKKGGKAKRVRRRKKK